MPSVGTETLTIRVKPDAKSKFKQLSEEEGISLAELLDMLMVTYENKGYTPEEDRGTPLENSGFDEFGTYRIVEEMRKREYPDNLIQRQIDNIVIQISESPRYNPRRDSGDWGC